MSGRETQQFLRRIQNVCEAFESAWESGSRPSIEDFLADWEGAQRDSLRFHLIAIEEKYRGEPQRQRVRDDDTGQNSLHETLAHSASGDTAKPTISGGVLPAGFQLGRYRIIRVLGQGGMGAVYLAHDAELDRRVALKVPKLSATGGDIEMERFAREARAAAAINHPNICPVFDIGTAENHHYITMAYVEGEPLSDVFRAAANTDQMLVASIIRKLALALGEAHDKGIVHRDLKPTNVMFSKLREPVLMDFGLARLVQQPDVTQLTHTGTIVGTPSYMSPEQVRGQQEAIGPATDIYSLGVMMYQLLSGELPFKGQLLQLLLAIAEYDPKPLVALRPNVDQRLSDLCMRMMAKKIADRPASMHEVARSLERITTAGSEPSVAETTPLRMPAEKMFDSPTAIGVSASPSGRPPTKNKWLMLAMGGAAAFVLFGLVIFIVRVGDKTVKVTVDNDAKKKTRIESDGESLKIRSGKQPIEVTAGKEQLVVKSNGLVAETNSLTVEEKGGVKLRIEAVKSRPAADDTPKKALERNTAPHRQLAVSEMKKPTRARRKPAPKFKPEVVAGNESVRLKLINRIAVSSGGVSAQTYSLDGRQIATGGRDNRVTIWDGETFERLHVIRDFGEDPSALAFSPDGATLVVGGRGMRLARYETATATNLGFLHKGNDRAYSFMCATYSADGKRIITGSSKELVDVWDAVNGQHLAAYDEHTHHVWGMRLSHDGTKLATIGWAGTALLWDANSQELIHTLPTASTNLYCVCFSGDDTKLFTAGNATCIYEYDVASGKRTRKLADLHARVIGADSSADGKWIAAATLDSDQIHVVNADTGHVTLRVNKTGQKPRGICFSPTDPTRFVSTGYDGTLRVWEIEVAEEGEIFELPTKQPPNPLLIEQDISHDHVLIKPWQTFKPQVDGVIEKIEIRANIYGGAAGNLNLYLGEGTGGKQLHQHAYEAPSAGGAPWTTFKLKKPLPVRKDVIYTWELTGAKGIYYAKDNPYKGGRASVASYDMCFRIHFAESK